MNYECANPFSNERKLNKLKIIFMKKAPKMVTLCGTRNFLKFYLIIWNGNESVQNLFPKYEMSLK